MLDIRATAYISPLSEVEFTDVVLTVRLQNFADETGYVTGQFRVYNDTTGELIHTSEIQPLSLAAGLTADASALTDFSPPAPLDDTYFVLFTGNASNPLVPDGINLHLGAFHFDVKPGPLGEAPAAHAPTHEQAGADPIETSDLGTSELDKTLRLAPDGAGGVLWTPETGSLDHGALSGLSDDDHPQYQLRTQFHAACDFPWNLVGAYPWGRGNVGIGTVSDLAGLPNHPGINRASSGAAANTGQYWTLGTAPIRLAGNESAAFIIRPQTLLGLVIYCGFEDSTTAAAPVDGVYAEIQNVGGTDGVLVGRTSSNSVRSTTATSYALTTNTWYLIRIDLNADATIATFTLYDESGAQLWQDTLNANIPTTVGRETSHGIVAYNTGVIAVAIVDIDYMHVRFNRLLSGRQSIHS